MRLQNKEIQPLHYDPTRVIVKVANKAIRALASSLHAPDNLKTTEHIEQWWDETERLVMLFADEDPVITFVDSNQQPAACNDGTTGDLQCPGGIPGKHHYCLHKFAQQTRSYITTTFAEYSATGIMEPTFFGQGAQTSNDQILLTEDIYIVPASVTPIHKWHTARDYEDHIPVAATIQMTVPVKEPITIRRKLSYDQNRVHENDRAQNFMQQCISTPMCSFAVEGSSHLHIITEHLKAAAHTAPGL